MEEGGEEVEEGGEEVEKGGKQVEGGGEGGVWVVSLAQTDRD